jgi:transcriptional regulator with XRE-family HTH domain
MNGAFKTHRRELGANIRKIRESRGLSTRVFCGMIGLNRRDLALIERGSISPKVVTLERIAAGLEVSVSSLVDFQTDGD